MSKFKVSLCTDCSAVLPLLLSRPCGTIPPVATPVQPMNTVITYSGTTLLPIATSIVTAEALLQLLATARRAPPCSRAPMKAVAVFISSCCCCDTCWHSGRKRAPRLCMPRRELRKRSSSGSQSPHPTSWRTPKRSKKDLHVCLGSPGLKR